MLYGLSLLHLFEKYYDAMKWQEYTSQEKFNAMETVAAENKAMGIYFGLACISLQPIFIKYNIDKAYLANNDHLNRFLAILQPHTDLRQVARDLLGISDDTQANRAYRKLMIKYHIDRKPDYIEKEVAQAISSVLTEAKDFLTAI